VQEAIDSYEEHVSGKSMRQVAREKDVQPSTILRQTRKVEDMREDPVFDHYMELREKGKTTLKQQSLDAMLTRAQTTHHTFVVSRDLSVAGVIDARSGRVVEPIPAEAIGALLASDAIYRTHEGKDILRYAAKKQASGSSDRAVPTRVRYQRTGYLTSYSQKSEMIFALGRRRQGFKIETKHVDAALDILMHWETFCISAGKVSVTDFLESDDEIAVVLWRLQGAFLETIIGLLLSEEMGLEEYEKKMEWPTRSAKLMLRCSLDAFIQIRS